MELQMNFDSVVQQGESIAARAQDVVDLKTWLDGVMNDQLPTIWRGSGYESFATRVSDMAPHFESMRQLIEDIGNGVITNAQQYREFDETVGSRNM